MLQMCVFIFNNKMSRQLQISQKFVEKKSKIKI